MFRIMSRSAFIAVLLLFLCPLTLQLTLPPKAQNPERIKLLKDLLSSMTFRRSGQLATAQDLEPFFGVLKDRYANSKYYKTLVIAFSRGVVPKLTLKENDPCVYAITREYKDYFNKSVTDARIRYFTFRSYDKREEQSRQFCDYREGLICIKSTSKCGCPPGSKMEPISQGSAVKRCLFQQNKICSLMDLDHDPSSNYGALKKLLPEMIFNFERPLGCKMGTQCRFKSANPTTPLCYEINDGPWDKGKWDIGLGEECTLGLYADTGQCQKTGHYLGGYTCFNFGPRSRPKSPRVGFCAHNVGSYFIFRSIDEDFATNGYGLRWDLQMIGFVSPATTPLRGKVLFDYYSKYETEIQTPLSVQFSEGESCNIRKTEKMLELWKFYKSLQERPPQGQDYVATEAELEAKLKEAKDLTVDYFSKGICRISTYLYPNKDIHPALKCVRNITHANRDNDGTCHVIPTGEDVTLEWAKTFMQFRVQLHKSNQEQRFAEVYYRKDIYEPELECDPKLGPPPGSAGAVPSTDTNVLEGGYCPPDRTCIEDYGQNLYIYDSECELKNGAKVYRNCQDLEEIRRPSPWITCEFEYLDKLFQRELNAMSTYSGLQRGDACDHKLENKFREWIKLNVGYSSEKKYKRMIELNKFIEDGGAAKLLCDRTKLLECSQKSGTCECLPNTQPREVILESGNKIYSDYCYFSSGDCDLFHNRLFFEESSETENKEIDRHYKARENEGGWRCQNSNWCVFLDDIYRCTTVNTGFTGHNGSDPVTTTTTSTTARTTTVDDDESKLTCVGEQCEWQDAGKAQQEIHVVFKMIILIKMLTLLG